MDEEVVAEHPEPAGVVVAGDLEPEGLEGQRHPEGMWGHYHHPEPDWVGVHLHPQEEVGGHLQVPGHLFPI